MFAFLHPGVRVGALTRADIISRHLSRIPPAFAAFSTSHVYVHAVLVDAAETAALPSGAVSRFAVFRGGQSTATSYRPKVFMDVSIGGKPAGRMVFEVPLVLSWLIQFLRFHPLYVLRDSWQQTSFRALQRISGPYAPVSSWRYDHVFWASQ